MVFPPLRQKDRKTIKVFYSTKHPEEFTLTSLSGHLDVSIQTSRRFSKKFMIFPGKDKFFCQHHGKNCSFSSKTSYKHQDILKPEESSSVFLS